MRAGRGLWPLAAGVFLGHVLLLERLAALPPVTSLAAGEGGAGAGAVFQVRPVQPAAPPAAAPPESPAQPRVASPDAAAAATQPPSPPPAPPAVPPAAPRAGRASPAGSAPASAADDLPYLPRGELTQAPRPLRPVDVPFPDVGGVVDLKVQLTLFIDERGVVQRVRIDTPDVAPVFERAIREAFGRAPFQPGLLGATPARAQFPVEVEFKGESPSRGR